MRAYGYSEMCSLCFKRYMRPQGYEEFLFGVKESQKKKNWAMPGSHSKTESYEIETWLFMRRFQSQATIFRSCFLRKEILHYYLGCLLVYFSPQYDVPDSSLTVPLLDVAMF